MARRDLNQRITPVTTENYQIQPVATPVDKLERFAPDLSSAARTKAKYEAIAQFGKGLLDVNTVWERQAQENAIAAYDKTAEKNRKDWAEVSKNFEGMEKFNPYNKDAYHKLVSAEITRKYVNNLYADPDLAGKTPEEVHAFIENNQQDLLTELRATGLKQKDYAQYLVSYSNRAYALSQQHIKDNAELEFKITKNKFSENTAFDMVTAINSGSTLTEAALNAENAMDSLGWTPLTKAEVINNALQNYVINNPEAHFSDIEAFVQSYKINGESLSTYIPNMSVQMQQFMRKVKEADFQDRKLEFEMQQFDQQLAVKSAFDNLVPRYINGELNNPDDFKQAVLEQAQENGLDGFNSVKLFSDIISGRQTITSLKANPSDPETKMNLGAGVADGTTTREDIAEAIRQGNLSFDDGANMLTQLTSHEQKVKTQNDKRVDDHLKDLTNEYLKDNKQAGTKAKLKSKNDKQWLWDKANELKAQYDKGEITYDEFNNKLSRYKQFILQDAEARKKGEAVSAMKNGYDDLRRTPQISDKQWEQVDVAKSKFALRRMGLIKTQFGNDNTVYIASAPQKYRESSGRRHTGYDIGGSNVKLGKPVYSPMAGEVVGVLKGDNGGMGNMVLIQCTNGKMIKYMHLQNANLPQLGTQVTKDTIIGHVGNTGAVENKAVGSLHVEFYDENHNWIPAYKFGV